MSHNVAMLCMLNACRPLLPLKCAPRPHPKKSQIWCVFIYTAEFQRPGSVLIYSFALTFLPDSSSASASAYSSSRCFLYIFAVCGRFIFSLHV